jgi:hypothetical protein
LTTTGVDRVPKPGKSLNLPGFVIKQVRDQLRDGEFLIILCGYHDLPGDSAGLH